MTKHDSEREVKPNENLAWKSNLLALLEDWEAGEMNDTEFFEAVMEGSTPATAADGLRVIGEKAARKFDLWFTGRYGSEIPKREFVISSSRPEVHQKDGQRLQEAFHRAILDRREPL